VALVLTKRVVGPGVSSPQLAAWQDAALLAYRPTRKILSAVAALARRDVSRAAELLVLRHESTVLRRHVKEVCYRPEDRLWFAALAGLIPRRR
jgi:hypothetical protein